MTFFIHDLIYREWDLVNILFDSNIILKEMIQQDWMQNTHYCSKVRKFISWLRKSIADMVWNDQF
jgi:pyruvate formate-lyase activating enzyme-like uncharacterized protein